MYHQKSPAFTNCYYYNGHYHLLQYLVSVYLVVNKKRVTTIPFEVIPVFIYPVLLSGWLFTRSRHQIKYFESRLELLFKLMGIIIEGAEVGTGSAPANVSFIGNLTHCLKCLGRSDRT